jgi:hypothetical protein
MSRRIVLHSSTLKSRRAIQSGKHQSTRDHSFACSLIKKLNIVAARNRVIPRHLRSAVLPARRMPIDERPIISNSFDDYVELDCTPQENEVPQKEWDDLYESAFEVIGTDSMDPFEGTMMICKFEDEE